MRRGLVVVVLSVLVLVGILLILDGTANSSVITGWVLLALVVAYLINSFSTMTVDEAGMITVFGRPIRDIKPGLHFTPAGIVRLEKMQGTMYQHELPSEPENIWKVEGQPPAGKFFPIRIKFGAPPVPPIDPIDIQLVGDPYNVEMVTEVVPVVVWHVKSMMQFRKKVGTPEECRRMLTDKTETASGDELATVTPAKAARTLSIINRDIKTRVGIETADWGIVIDNAYLKPILYSHGMNEAVENVSKAHLAADVKRADASGTADAIRTVADAKKYDLVQTGRAKVNAMGNITKLVPDSNVKAHADAIAALKDVKTVVLSGDKIAPVLAVGTEN